MAGKWTGGIVDAPIGDEPPTVEEWVPVSVPDQSTAFTDADEPIAYRTTFADPRGHGAERTRIQLRGAYGSAHCWINGDYLGAHSPYFVPATVEFEPQRENELVVCCERAEHANGMYGTDQVPADLAVPGIWWGVSLQIRPATFVGSLSVAPRLTDDGAVIEAEIEIDAGEAVDDAVTFSLRPEGFRGGGSMERVRVEAPAGERVTVSKSLEVRDPKRWWPRGHGPQHRYTVRAKLGDDSSERTVGLRTIERDEKGLLVNGRRLRGRGVCRLPSTAADEHEDVRRIVAANANLVRAHGHVPSREFYAACDEAGVLVWQDLPIAGSDFSVERATSLLESLVQTYGAHPSLATVGVQTDPVDPFPEPLGSGFLSKLAFRWRAWRTGFDRSDADAVAATVPAELPVVPVSGPPGIDPDAATLSPGWRYLEAGDIEWLLDRYPSLGRIATVEVGSLAVGGGTDASAEPNPGPETDSAPRAIPGLDPAILEKRGTDVEDSQAYQAATVKTVTEALRRRGCGLVVAPAIRDTAPGGGVGVLTNDGSRKPAYEALTASFEPVQAVLDDPPVGGSKHGITLLNDTAEKVDATVTWRAGEASSEVSVSADALERVPAGTVEIPPEAAGVVLETSFENRTVQNGYHL